MLTFEVLGNQRLIFSSSEGVSQFKYQFWGRAFSVVSDNQLYFYSRGALYSFFSIFSRLIAATKYLVFIELRLVGLGFRFIRFDSFIIFKVGRSHYVKVFLPLSVHFFGCRKRFLLCSSDYAVIRQLACTIQLFNKPDVYKNKGIQILGFSTRIKPGKKEKQ